MVSGFWANTVRPLEQCCYPINQPIHYTCTYPIHNHRAGDGKHLCADTEDKALGFEFHSRGGDGVGKAGNGHQSTGSGILCDIVVKAQPRQQDRQADQSDTHAGGGISLVEPDILIQIHSKLPQGTDAPADEKCPDAVFPYGGIGAGFLNQFAVLFFRHNDPSQWQYAPLGRI